MHVLRRYIFYFWAVLCSSPGPVGLLPKPRTVQVRQVTIRGLPAGTADSCMLLVEARPSGSLAPRGSRVCLRVAPRALGGGASGEGICVGPLDTSLTDVSVLHMRVDLQQYFVWQRSRTGRLLAQRISLSLQHMPLGWLESTVAGISKTWAIVSTCLLWSRVSGAGLCMVPCAHAPLVQGDSCSISTDALGDTLTFKIPAASLGLCLLPHNSSSTAAHAAHSAHAAHATGPGCLDTSPKATVVDSRAVHALASHMRPEHEPHAAPCAGTAADVSTAGAPGCCMLCGAASSRCCACTPAAGDLPGSVPSHESAEVLPGATPHIQQASNTSPGLCEGSQGMGTGFCGVIDATASAWCAHHGSGSACAEPVWPADPWEATVDEGCCVVEGDVRLMVRLCPRCCELFVLQNTSRIACPSS
jgi:hypothetical protein